MDAVVAEFARSCVLMSRAPAPAAWVGPGRPVSARGVLRRGDVAAACAACGLDDPGRVRSAADVPALHRAWVAADGVRLIPVGLDEAVAATPPDDPLAQWLAGFGALLRTESADEHRIGAAVVCRVVLGVLDAPPPPWARCCPAPVHPSATATATTSVTAGTTRSPWRACSRPSPTAATPPAPRDAATRPSRTPTRTTRRRGRSTATTSTPASPRSTHRRRRHRREGVARCIARRGKIPMTYATNCDVAAAAAKSEVARQVVELVSWVGEGRPLTGTGALRLADARVLVERLGTGDVIDPAIGDRIFKTRSSAELLGLCLIVEWAKAARLVREVRGRLVPVRKNAGLLDQQAELWTALFATFGRLGPAFLPTGWGESLLRAEFKRQGSSAILSALHLADGPVHRATLCALAWDVVTARYVLDDATAQQLDTARELTTATSGVRSKHCPCWGRWPLTETTAELTALGRDAARRSRGEPAPGEPVHQVVVTLCEVDDPPVWRRLLVPSAISLDRLHDVLQAAMGWQNSHLHSFTDGHRTYGHPDPELGFRDERSVRLGDLDTDRLGYTYDFGDGWEHEIVVDAVVDAEAGGRYPCCLDGGGACPPEDCGGPPGYPQLRTVLATPPTPSTRTSWPGWA